MYALPSDNWRKYELISTNNKYNKYKLHFFISIQNKPKMVDGAQYVD